MTDPILRKAKKKVRAKKGFFIHAGVMAIISVFLLIIGFTDGENMAIPVSALWVSVAIHYLSVWGIPGFGQGGQDWEANELEKEYLRLKRLEDTKKNLSNDEYLELRELEKRHRDEDFV